MNKTTDPTLLTLLGEVYPNIKEGPAQDLFLMHCAELVGDERYGLSPGDTKLATRALGLLRPQNRARQLGGAAGASAVRQALLARVKPWIPTGTATKGWGWAAMTAAVSEQDGDAFRALMRQPGAPGPEEINQRDFEFTSTDRTTGKPVETRGSIVAVLLLSLNSGSMEEQFVDLARSMGQAGIDFNGPLRGGHGDAFSHITFPFQLDAMVASGARMDQKNELGRAALTQILISAHPAQFPHLVNHVAKLCREDAGFCQTTTTLWPELLDGLSGGLARMRDDNAVKTGYQACQALADQLELALGAGPNQPSFFALFCRHRLDLGSIGKVDAYLNTRLTDWKTITHAKDIRNKWSGQIEPGIPDGVWGLILEAQNEKFSKGHAFARERATTYMAGNPENFWAGALNAWNTFSDHPAVWNATSVLSSSFPKASAHLFRRAVMEGLVAYRQRNGQEHFSGQKKVSAVATQVLKSITKDNNPTSPQDVELAVRVQLCLGSDSSLTLHALEHLSKHHPEALNRTALHQALNAGRRDFSAEAIAKIEAVIMSMDTPQVEHRRNGPRL